MKLTQCQIEEKFMTDVAVNDAVDATDEHDWHSLAYGYMLALGMSPGEETSTAAYRLSVQVATDRWHRKKR